MSPQPKNIESIYPLSPMQQGMLFHILAKPGSGDYVNQLHMTLSELDVAAFKQAWQQLIERHAVLRTLFVWEGRQQPLQVVRRTVELRWLESDWRMLSVSQQEEELRALLAQERRRDFPLSEAPLLRCQLARRSEQTYEFIWTYSHLVTDGWSLSLLFNELFALYAAARQGQTFLRPTPRPFEEYIAWLQERDRGSAEAFWRRYLAGMTAPTPLLLLDARGTDGAAPLHAEHGVLLSRELLADLSRTARTYELTLNTLFMAAWGLMLGRYAGEPEVLFGTVVSGRPADLPGVETMVGVFINTLPLRIRFAEDVPVSSWLQRIQGEQAERERYGYAPLWDIQKWSGMPAGTRLFDSIAAFENYPIEPMQAEIGGRASASIASIAAVDQTNFPLELLVLLEPETTFKIGYAPSHFAEATIRRMGEHLVSLLQSIVADPVQPLRSVQMMTRAELQQVLIAQNATATPYPRDLAIPVLFTAQARRTPSSVAVVYGDERLTYAELDCRSNQLARCLQHYGVGERDGVGQGTLVGLYVERSVEMVVAMLAILKAGGAYVPLEPGDPRERQSFMLSDTAAPIVLAQRHLMDRLPKMRARLLWMEDLEVERATYSPAELSNEVLPTDRAYVMYTSGSTGQPKGVVVSHRAIVRLVQETDYIEISERDRVGQAANAAFDASTLEIWGALLNGARLVGLEREVILAAPQLVARLREQEISILFLTTALFHQIVGLIPDAFLSLRCLLVGGEAMDPVAVRQVLRHGKPTRLLNVYGPTENTTFSTWFEITQLGDTETTVSIGQPLANSQTYVLDKELRPVPVGCQGELHVGGDGLAEGYLNRPELTAERFVMVSLAGVGPQRLYKTGDLVRYRPDPSMRAGLGLEFLGRIDNQIKLRGFRIEPGEIEAALVQNASVQAAAVVVHQQAGSKQLVAYVVPRAESGQHHASANTLGSVLRSYLTEKLPDYMVPSAVVMLESLPLLPSGKIDRRALSSRRIEHPAFEPKAEARSETERSLLAIWGEVLRVERVGIHDNFFELGGDSILSMQIISRARKAGIFFSTKQLFQCATVARLAAVAELSAGPIAGGRSAVTGAVPLTPIQRWFFAQSFVAPHHFNQSSLLKVAPDVNPERLQQAISQLLIHHDALRLRYRQTGGGWAQHIEPPSPEAAGLLTLVELAGLPPDEQATRFAAHIARLQRTLHLEAGPIIAAALFRMGAGQPARLFLTVHHLAIDGVSWRILLEDLQTAYQCLRAEQRVTLPERTTSFQRWSQWIVDRGHELLQAELPFWTTYLPTTAAALPRDFEAGENRVATASRVTASLTQEQTRAFLQEAQAAYHTRVSDLLLTALLQTMSEWTGQPDVLIWLEEHGREELDDQIDLSRTVGWFTSLFPVHLRGGTGDIGATLKSVKEQLRQIPNHGVGYGVLRYIASAPALARLPQPEISFNYMGQFDQIQMSGSSLLLTPDDGACDPEVSALNRRTNLLDVTAIIIGGRMEIGFSYSTKLHRRDTIFRLCARYVEALCALISHCCAATAASYTPSDFPQAGLDQAGLDRALAVIALENLDS